MFKKSFYNIEVETLANGDILLYNSLRSTFGIMDLSTRKLYDSIEELSDEDIKHINDDINFQTLVRNGYIIPQDFNELDWIKVKSNYQKYMQEGLVMTIAPTLECNMACPYCYEKNKSGFMDNKIQIILCDFIKGLIKKNNYKKIHISWYGGEPLLAVDIINSISKNVIEICKDNNINYSASIITNGVLLTRDVAVMLHNECCVNNAQITIDGLPEYHNKRRCLKDGRNSFDIIMNNIEMCKDIISIIIRVNVDKNNINNIDKLTNLFIEKGWIANPSVYLAPVGEYTDSCYFRSGEVCLTKDEFSDIDTKTVNKLYEINPSYIRDKLYPTVKNNYCAAVEYNKFVVDPKGDLYTCWNCIGDKERSIGNIIQKSIMSPEYIKWLAHEPDEKCLSCKLLPNCMGGCPYEFFQKGYAVCEKRLSNYKDKLKLAYTDFISNKQNKNK